VRDELATARVIEACVFDKPPVLKASPLIELSLYLE
jgi:hypothetical protein